VNSNLELLTCDGICFAGFQILLFGVALYAGLRQKTLGWCLFHLISGEQIFRHVRVEIIFRFALMNFDVFFQRG
jgi:hypothetical protein